MDGSFQWACKYCMRFDCAEKGGPVEKCPADRGEEVRTEHMELSYKRFKDWTKTKDHLEG